MEQLEFSFSDYFDAKFGRTVQFFMLINFTPSQWRSVIKINGTQSFLLPCLATVPSVFVTVPQPQSDRTATKPHFNRTVPHADLTTDIFLDPQAVAELAGTHKLNRRESRP